MTPEKVYFFYKRLIFDKIPKDIKEKVAVAGGAVRDKIANQTIKDIDIFVQDKKTEKKIMKFFSDNGTEVSVNEQLANYKFQGQWVQVIRGKYYDMKSTEIIDSFDFTICQAMVVSSGIKVGRHFYESLATRSLRINKITYPLSTLERLQKYIKKGYSACNGTLLEIAKAINGMDKEVLNLQADDPSAKNNSLFFYSDGTPRFVGVD